MATTVSTIYDEVCSILLEDGGLQFVYTEAAFLKDLATCLSELLQATGIVKKFICTQLLAGTGEYQLPVVGMDVQAAFADNSFIYDSFTFNIDHSDQYWHNENGMPWQWRMDQLAANTIEVAPSPDYNGREVLPDTPLLGVPSSTSSAYDFDLAYAEPLYGTISQASGDYYAEFTGPMFGTISSITAADSNLCMLATAQPSNTNLTLDSVLELIPDSLTPYLPWMILAKLWASDGEAKDVTRARYANTRRIEVENICKALLAEDMLEKS